MLDVILQVQWNLYKAKYGNYRKRLQGKRKGAPSSLLLMESKCQVHCNSKSIVDVVPFQVMRKGNTCTLGTFREGNIQLMHQDFRREARDINQFLKICYVCNLVCDKTECIEIHFPLPVFSCGLGWTLKNTSYRRVVDFIFFKKKESSDWAIQQTGRKNNLQPSISLNTSHHSTHHSKHQANIPNIMRHPILAYSMTQRHHHQLLHDCYIRYQIETWCLDNCLHLDSSMQVCFEES